MMAQRTQNTREFPRPIDSSAAGAIFALLALTIGIAGTIYIKHQFANARKAAHEQLAAIADLKIREIANWYAERQADAAIVRDSPIFEDHIKRFLADPSQDRIRQPLQTWMETQRKANRYHDVVLFDASGTPLLWAGPDMTASRPSVSQDQHFHAALLAKDVLTTDLHRARVDPKLIHFSLWIPVGIKPQANAPADGVLLLRLDASEFLYPLIQSWPTPSRTAETILLRREGNDALYLNELRHRANTALDLRVPINTSKPIPATMAVVGREGISEGVDYRDVPVLAAMRAVPGTPWCIVAKIDQEEVYAPFHRRAWTTGMFVVLAILSAGLGLGLIWRQRESRWLNQRIAERQQAEEVWLDTMHRLQLATTSAKLGVWDWDLMNNRLVWDQRMFEIYGIRWESGLGTYDAWRNCLHPDDVAKAFEETEAVLRGAKEYDTEFRIVRPDGAVRIIKANAVTIRDQDGKPLRQIGLNRDITEQRQAEAALRESEEHYRVLFDRANEGIVLLSTEGILKVVNEAFARMHGYTLEEIRHLNLKDLDAPESLAMIEPRMRRLLAGEALNFEVKHYHKDGHVFPLDVSASLISLRGQPLIQCFHRDITERKRMEETLRESERRFRNAIEFAPFPIMIHAEDGQVVTINAAWTQLTGYTLSDIPTTAAWAKKAYGKDDVRIMQEIERLYGRNEAVSEGEYTIQTLSGKPRIWEFMSAPLGKFSDGRRAIISMAMDVTERKRAEEAVRRSEERIKVTMDQMMEGGQILGFDWRFLYINDAAARQGHKPKEAFLGRRIMDVLPGIENTAMFGLLKRCMEERRPQHMENEFVYHDGSKGWFDLSIQPVEEGIFILSIDISERKRLEAQLLQSQKLEAIGRLAGGIAHDFRNQLTIVKGYSEMLLRMSLIKDDKEHLVGEILKATHRGSQLTGQLLAFSRKDMLQPSRVNLSQLVADLAGPIGRLVGEDIVITTTGGRPDCGVEIATAQFEHAMMNLAANARDAMPQGGELTLDTACVDVDASMVALLPDAKVGPYVRVTVRDSGSGMDPATLSRLFEPFFTTKVRGKGTGLGLPMVYGFVRQSGGFITVESEPGKGTSFALHFPRVVMAGKTAEPEAGKTAASPAGDNPRGTETVLVVEDEEPIRWLMTHGLRESGYTVIETGDAQQAIELANAPGARIDLLITDVVMPGISGVELAALISHRRPGIPVLFVSGYDSETLMRRGVDLASAQLLVKPFDHKKLLQSVRNFLDVQRPVE